ncbi:hypothetical protein AVEN_238811-1, partial [Araneus ventricosus]
PSESCGVDCDGMPSELMRCDVNFNGMHSDVVRYQFGWYA